MVPWSSVRVSPRTEVLGELIQVAFLDVGEIRDYLESVLDERRAGVGVDPDARKRVAESVSGHGGLIGDDLRLETGKQGVKVSEK